MSEPGTRATLANAGRGVAVLLFTYFALAIVFNLIPRSSYMRAVVEPWFADFSQVTGVEQDWSMFTEIPQRNSTEISIQAMDLEGSVHSFGPIVPGLKQYDWQQDTFRYHTFFSRIMTDDFRTYVKPYAESVAKELEQRHADRQLISYGVELRSNDISFLSSIRNGGPLTFRQTFSMGPWDLSE